MACLGETTSGQIVSVNPDVAIRELRRISRDIPAPRIDVIQGDVEASPGGTANHEVRMDLNRALTRLKRRERELLWLAYAQGSSHQEIGESLGLKTGSIKPLLFRARHKLAGLLRGGSSGGRRA